jgi:hypothetical protein
LPLAPRIAAAALSPRSASRDAVVPGGIVDRRRLHAVRQVIGERKHLLDADVPVRILDRESAEPQVGDLAHRREVADLLDRRAQHDSVRRPRVALGQLDRHEPCEPGVAFALDDEVRDAPRGWVDHDVDELPERCVRALDAASELQSHLSLLPLQGRAKRRCHPCQAAATGGVGAAVPTRERDRRPQQPVGSRARDAVAVSELLIVPRPR